MAASKHASSWSDLHADLLDLLLRRLHSLADRVRVGAVCRPWRSGARLHPKLPPPMPWVALGDEAYLDIVNNAVHRLNLTVPRDANCRGSVDHLLFITRAGGGCFLANPFYEVMHPVTDLALFLEKRTQKEMFSFSSKSIKKVVAHWPQGSSAEPVVAAVIANRWNWYESTIFLCRAGTDTGVGKESYHAMSVKLRRVLDIAFFRGNLYALYSDGELLAVEIGEGSGGNLVITNVKYAIKNSTAARSNLDINDDEDDKMVDFLVDKEILPTEDYLVESGDQLLKLNRVIIDARSWDTSIFDVYEADLDASPCQWKPAQSLRGRALFLGRSSSNSKSVRVGDGHYGAKEDCIYFAHHAGDSGIYNVRSRKMMKPLVPDTKVLERSRRPWIPAWVFPDQSISTTKKRKR